jgi:hypothetical protein
MTMRFDPKSISDQIQCLARLTGASEPFVAQVMALFEKKGISLSAEATPYIEALEEAFRREESIRTSSARARNNLSTLQSKFKKVGQAYVQQVERLRQSQSNLQGQAQRLRGGKGGGSGRPVVIHGDHRTYVTKPQREDLPLVPGPKEQQ